MGGLLWLFHLQAARQKFKKIKKKGRGVEMVKGPFAITQRSHTGKPKAIASVSTVHTVKTKTKFTLLKTIQNYFIEVV